jgi:quercetin dioxygenase-like cupin family protein
MPYYNLAEVAEELVTPQHSTALGRLITGTQVEFGILRFKANEGAKVHAHPHEQVVYVIRGKMRVTTEGTSRVLGPGEAVLFPPNVPHQTTMLEETEVVSVKGIVDGVGHKI